MALTQVLQAIKRSDQYVKQLHITLKRLKVELRVGVSIGVLVLVSGNLMATPNILPKASWEIEIYSENSMIDTMAVNKSGDKVTWERIGIRDLKLGDFELYRRYDEYFQNNLGSFYEERNQLDSTTKLIESWLSQVTYINIYYGLTQRVTIFLNTSYENTVLDYTSKYELESKKIKENFQLLGEGSRYKRLPDKAVGDHINDIFLGAKIRVLKFFMLEFKMTAGLLRIGQDAKEKVVEEQVEELQTGREYNEWHAYIIGDYQMGPLLIYGKTGYIWMGESYQRQFDNQDIQIDLGDRSMTQVGAKLNLPFKTNIEWNIMNLKSAADKYKGGNSKTAFHDGYDVWTQVPESDTHLRILQIKVGIELNSYLTVYGSSNQILNHQLTGQLYEFPGRIEPETIFQLGATVNLY